MKPKLVIFASGTKDGGGSGFENLVQASRNGILDADIVAVVSNHEHGGVRQRADKLSIPFKHFRPEGGPTKQAGEYQRIVRETKAEWVALSGWLKLVHGLDPKRTFNIHPALLSQLGGQFGGEGMYGHHVHKAVKHALATREICESGFTMHFVTKKYDRGPVFVEVRTGVLPPWMSADEIDKRVNTLEHRFQPIITNLVVHEKISWNGKDPESLRTPVDLQNILKVI